LVSWEARLSSLGWMVNPRYIYLRGETSLGRGKLLTTSTVPVGAKSFRLSMICALVAASFMLGSTMLPTVAIVSAEASVGDYFEYEYNTHVDHGKDYYAGYSDTMRSSSRYEVTAVQGDQVTMKATGSWTFEGSDGAYDSGTVDISFNYSQSTRRYLGPTDVESTYIDPSVWFWIPPNLDKGQSVRILEDIFTVTSADKTVWMGIIPHKVIELTTSGSYTRDDDYGVFTATYDDTYCFDRQSGYLVSERYVEQDEGYQASFRFTADLKVTSSSYTTPTDWLTLLVLYVMIPAAVILVILLIRKWRRGPSRIKVNTLSGEADVEIRPVRRAAEMDALVPGGSRYFTPFLPVFAKRAISEGDPVVVASSSNSMIGMAMMDKESHLGSVFALDEMVARTLVKRLRLRDFFLEVDGHTWEFPSTFNIDTFEILELRNPRPVPYDTTHVRPMKHDDIPDVVRIAEDVYKGPAERWVTTCFEGGDVAYVADNYGRVVGFGFATIVGSNARLHTLTMSPSFRASGLGTEIMAARLTVLSALGVDRVIVEISKHNDASMSVARNAGFNRIGETVYYSSRPSKVETVSQRRF
jgi:L-amino acid N-acyltransferase YncA